MHVSDQTPGPAGPPTPPSDNGAQVPPPYSPPSAYPPPAAAPSYPGSAATPPSHESSPASPPSYPSAPPAYGAPAYTPYPSAPKTNVLAIVSLVSSLVGMFIIPFLGSLAGVITGHIALKQVKNNGEGGRGLAIAGTIIGWVGVVFSVIGIALLITFFAIGFSQYDPYMSDFS